MIPLIKFISATEIDKIFINIPVSKADRNVSAFFFCPINLNDVYICASQDLVKLHKSLLTEIQDSVQSKNAENLHQIFIIYKDRYYCIYYFTWEAKLWTTCYNVLFYK